MIEIDTPEINVEKIMARIRQEVQKYDDEGSFAKATQKGLFSPCPVFPVCDDDTLYGSPIPCSREGYCLSDFLGCHGGEFVDNAYRAILQREADPQGKELYLSRLQNGSFTRIDILGRLRYSREGRSNGVAVKGLLVPFIIQTLFKVPVLGWLLRILAGVLNLPGILKNIRVLEGALFEQNRLARKQQEKIRSHLAELRNHLAGVQEEISRVIIAEREAAAALSNELSETKKEVNAQQRSILDMQRSFQLLLEEARKGFVGPVSFRESGILKSEEDHLLDALYVNFEDRFRGTRGDIKERVWVYLPHVKQAVKATGNLPVLDVGCGRGEWLELLRENEINARGVDLNRVMVAKCTDMGLDVLEADLIHHLRGLQADSLSVITGFHIVEHLPLKTLIILFDEALRVLKPNGIVIFETPNPENLLVGACSFYTDPTHERPIPPVTLSFLIEARGFTQIEVLRLNPNSSINIEDSTLNHYFTVGQDYSVIGFKA